MRRWLGLVGTGWMLATGACGPHPPTEDPSAPRFSAEVTLNPLTPQPGSRLFFNVDVINHSLHSIRATVEASVVDERDDVLYRRAWEDVPFAPEDRYGLLGSFLTEYESVDKVTFISIRVLGAEDGGVLLEHERIAQFAASWSQESSPSGSGKADAGKPDTGKPDAGKPDAGKPDAGKPDAGRPDAGSPDAGRSDGGR